MPSPSTESPRHTWSNAPERFPPGRFAVVEPIGLAVHDWSRPQPGRPRMFDQRLLEWFSHISRASVVVVYLPASAFFVWYGLRSGLSLAQSAALFAVGLFAWTLLEYLNHRFAFHYVPRGRIGMFYAYMIHGVHHAFPDDDRRWLVPPIMSGAVAAAIYVVLQWLLPSVAPAVFAGGLAGYLSYDLLHFALHRGSSRFALINRLRKRHLQHHYATPERWFGITTPLWDYVFRTTAVLADRER